MAAGMVPSGADAVLAENIVGADTSFDVVFPEVFPSPYGYEIRLIYGSNTEDVTLDNVTGSTLDVTRGGSPLSFPTGAIVRFLVGPPDGTGGGGGGITGPISSTDRAIATWNGTGGSALRNNAPLIASDGRITTVTDPTGDQDAVNLRSVAAQIVALVSSRRAVRLVTVAALPAYTRSTNTLTATANGALSVDGVAVAVGDRILNRHGTGADRGIFTVTATGSGGAPYVLDRATDADAAGDLATGQIVNVTAGSTRTGAAYYLSTTGTITLNTTTLTYDPLVPPRGSAANVQYRDSTTGEQEGAANAVITAGDVTLLPYSSTEPSAPASGSTIFAMLRAGRHSFHVLGAAGTSQGFAPDWLTAPRVWTAGSSTTPDLVNSAGMGTINGGGSVAAQAVADTNYLTQFQRLRHTTSATANNHCGWRATWASIFTSTTANQGGFFWQSKFSIHTNPTSGRYLFGVLGTSSNIPLTGSVEPSALTNVAAFMVDSGETVFSWGTNDGSGACTRSSITGAALTGDTYLYVASIMALPGSTDIYYALERYDTSGTMSLLVDSVSTTNVPAATTLLYDYSYGTPSAASAMAIDMCCVTLQRWR